MLNSLGQQASQGESLC